MDFKAIKAITVYKAINCLYKDKVISRKSSKWDFISASTDENLTFLTIYMLEYFVMFCKVNLYLLFIYLF